jgi:transcriptional regulator with XRE-family HTH domain
MPAPLSAEARERIRKALIEEVLPRFDKDVKRAQSAAATALKVNQSTISRLVTSGRGGSVNLAEAIAKFLNESPSRLLGHAQAEAPAPKLREVPGFAAAMQEARRQIENEYRGLNPLQLEAAADHRMFPPPEKIIPGLLIQLALCLPMGAPGRESRSRRKK